VKANRLVLLAAAGASVFTLSGCAQTGDVAATVNGTTISNADVNFLAQRQCSSIAAAKADPAQASGVQTQSRKQVRSAMVNALVQAELDSELGNKAGVTYDRATYRQAMDAFEAEVQKAPAKDRSRFRELVGSLYRGQLEVYAIAARGLAGQGVAQPTQEQIQSTVAQLQAGFRAKAKIDIDPAYGPDDKGVAGAADDSLSKAVSSFAKASLASPPDAAWVDDLPANQKCG
jgi:N-acetylmuramoyl-L-alanine amidase